MIFCYWFWFGFEHGFNHLGKTWIKLDLDQSKSYDGRRQTCGQNRKEVKSFIGWISGNFF